jgi:hypothetical protein
MQHHNSNQIQSLFGQNIPSASVQAFLRFGVHPTPLDLGPVIQPPHKNKNLFLAGSHGGIIFCPENKERQWVS